MNPSPNILIQFNGATAMSTLLSCLNDVIMPHAEYVKKGVFPPQQKLKQAYGRLKKNANYEAVELEIHLHLTACPRSTLDALKRAIFNKFSPYHSEEFVNGLYCSFFERARAENLMDRINFETEGTILPYLIKATGQIGRILYRSGIYRFSGIAYALSDYISGANDELIGHLIEKGQLPKGSQALKWKGTNNDAAAFWKAVGLSAKSFNRAFGTNIRNKIHPGISDSLSLAQAQDYIERPDARIRTINLILAKFGFV